MANNKNKKYYKKNYYHHNNNNYQKKPVENKKTYESLMSAKVITKEPVDSFNNILIMKYIAISVVIFAIIIGSFILFRSN